MIKMNLSKSICLSFMAWIVGWSVAAQSLEEGKKLYKEGKFDQAVTIFEKQIKKTPKQAALNQWYGASLFEIGKYEEAEPYLRFAASKRIPEAYKYLARLCFVLYQFDEGLENYDLYIKTLKKNQEAIDALQPEIEKMKMGKRFLSRVEEVQIIDSLIVDKKNFFTHFRMSPESGKIFDYGTFFDTSDTPEGATVYQTQRGDKIVYADEREGSGFDIFSRTRLSDDSWSEPSVMRGQLNTSANEKYPFLLSDGVTLYFASDGEESLGGYDIFVTRYDLNNDAYLAPENVGMPFNSVFNDYMMAIDEMNNVGWFVSDRYQPEGQLIIYLFIPNAEKVVYRGEDQDWARSLAQIRSIKQTWKPDTSYAELIDRIMNMPQEEKTVPKGDFMFIVNDNTIYIRLDDFKNQEARSLYEKAQATRKSQEGVEQTVAELRRRYETEKDKRESLSKDILSLEEQLKTLYGQTEKYEIQARNAEIQTLNGK